ncbi:MAG: cysteine--1-D-myo-inosityl 2-amino-2-deoxy-alpha-D-glucopyranoside ligase [Bifidobacteriaceae bacterium]|nr:cysteine--1-D-myo-inosityl 2-amino-2-deoxy-alpha-D-glucopyranoside ligase [Bifidobacteriaceae bacterium]
MHSWPRPDVPTLPGHGDIPVLVDAGAGEALPSARPTVRQASLYVCGITPYDATHLGHAATYLAFDLLVRAWLDVGREVTYAQCVTDIDDPLLERAQATGEDWRSLAAREVDVYRADMAALRIIPPDHYIGVTEIIDPVADAGVALERAGLAYRIPAPDGGTDLYADLAADREFGSVARLDPTTMRELFAERGGDPDRPGKRGPLDPLLWRARRDGEPWWASPLGDGRPGWHIECAVIAARHLGVPFDVQGGGTDLAFPHHEMGTSHLRGVSGVAAPVAVHVHTGLIGLDGVKMSKSLGNLVLVSDLVADGVAPAAIRLALLAGHYRISRDWTPELLATAQRRLEMWKSTLAPSTSDDAGPAERETVALMRRALTLDLDSPAAIAAVDRYVAARPADQTRSGVVGAAVEALLGIDLG